MDQSVRCQKPNLVAAGVIMTECRVEGTMRSKVSGADPRSIWNQLHGALRRWAAQARLGRPSMALANEHDAPGRLGRRRSTPSAPGA